MGEFRSWLMSSASKLTAHRQTAGKLALAAGVFGLVLAGYVYGPATADRQALAEEPAARTAIAPIVIAQATPTAIKQQIPLPAPAEIAPLTRADIAQTSEAATDPSVEAKIPLPQPAEISPITAADVAPSTTASVPQTVASTPAANTSTQDATAPATAAEATNEAGPQLDAAEIRKLTGKDLLQAPVAASLSVADSGIARSLRELLATRLERYVDRREDRQAVEAFYRDRGFAPLWIENGKRADRTGSAIKYIGQVGADGLEPADYPVPDFAAAEAQALAVAEIRFTNSILDLIRHARTGRVHFTRVSGDIHYDLEFPDPGEALTKLAAASEVGPIIDAHFPQHAAYKALKTQLAQVRGLSGEPKVVRIPEGPTLKPGMEDSRVAILRKRLKLENQDDWRYDEVVTEAVIEFQRTAGLTPDGLAGPATLRALNGVRRIDKADAILATMERWRWMPRDLGRNHSILNIPDFTLKVVKNGSAVWQTRVVVGKQSTQTPLLSDTMKFITVNPTWNVPPSIIANEYLPALQQDPTVLDRMGLRLEENRDGTVRIYQPPGDSNALGRLRFNFPNKFLVYQHDTPDKHLFARDVRAYSHGCMRVQDPVKYAEVLLSIVLPQENYTQQRIRGMFGPGEININFPQPLPVHITYQTAFVDEAGDLQVRDDIYGHDARLLAILKGSERRIADVPMSRPKVVISREELRLPGGIYYGAYDAPFARGPRYGYGRNPVEDFFRSIFR